MTDKCYLKLRDLQFEARVNKVTLVGELLIDGKWKSSSELIPYLERINRTDVIDDLAKHGFKVCFHGMDGYVPGRTNR